jgi:hypothetical protein
MTRVPSVIVRKHSLRHPPQCLSARAPLGASGCLFWKEVPEASKRSLSKMTRYRLPDGQGRDPTANVPGILRLTAEIQQRLFLMVSGGVCLPLRLVVQRISK